MKRNTVYIGAACLLCLALVAVAPAAAAGGYAGGQQTACPSDCTEHAQTHYCHGAGTGGCQYSAAAGSGACDQTCDHLQNQTCDRICDRTCQA